jgi:hypothetical protein
MTIRRTAYCHFENFFESIGEAEKGLGGCEEMIYIFSQPHHLSGCAGLPPQESVSLATPFRRQNRPLYVYLIIISYTIRNAGCCPTVCGKRKADSISHSPFSSPQSPVPTNILFTFFMQILRIYDKISLCCFDVFK